MTMMIELGREREREEGGHGSIVVEANIKQSFNIVYVCLNAFMSWLRRQITTVRHNNNKSNGFNFAMLQ